MVAKATALVGNKRAMRRLLDQDCNSWLLTACDDFGRTLTMFAAMCDRVSMLKLLIDRGASPLFRDKFGLQIAILK